MTWDYYLYCIVLRYYDLGHTIFIEQCSDIINPGSMFQFRQAGEMRLTLQNCRSQPLIFTDF